MTSKNHGLYNHIADIYDARQENPATAVLRKKEVSLIRKFSKGLVLDLGCGTGYHLDCVGKQGGKIQEGWNSPLFVGLDISESMLRIAKNKNKPLVQGHMENLPIKPKSVDTICCFYGTLNFVGLDALKEMGRIAKDGSKVLISVTSVMDIGKYRSSPESKIKKFRIGGQKIKMRLFEKEEIVEAFEREGFKLVSFDSIFRIQKPRWGNFQKFSFLEKLRMKIEKLFPGKWGKVYLFVFEKTQSNTT